MGWLMAVLGTGLALAGTCVIYLGAPYIQLEWGFAEVVAGTVALSAGILTVGIAAVLFALRRLTATVAGSGRPPAPVAPPAPVPSSEPAVSIPAPREIPPPAAEPPPAEAPTVVGRYDAEGGSYVLFSDGTIEVETEAGTHRYASMDELRAHIAEAQGR